MERARVVLAHVALLSPGGLGIRQAVKESD